MILIIYILHYLSLVLLIAFITVSIDWFTLFVQRGIVQLYLYNCKEVNI